MATIGAFTKSNDWFSGSVKRSRSMLRRTSNRPKAPMMEESLARTLMTRSPFSHWLPAARFF